MFSSRRAIVVALVASAVTLLVAAVAPGAGKSSPSAAAARKAVPSFELRIGTILSFTGSLSATGPAVDASAKLASGNVINRTLKQMGLQKKIVVKIVASEDDQTQASKAIEAATKEVSIDKVNVIIGTMSSASTIAMAQAVTIPKDVIVITPTGSAPQITDLQDNNLVWRILPSDNFQGKALTGAVSSAFGKNATINVGARNDAFGTALKSLFIDTWKAGGGKIGADVGWDPNQATFDSEAQRLVAGSPDGWVIIDFPTTFAKVGAALVRTGKWAPTKTFMTDVMSAPQSLKQVGDQATVGLRGTSPTAQAATLKQVAAFADLFKKTGRTSTGFEGTGFDAVMVTFLAALEARSSKPDAIKAHMRSVSGPPGTVVTYLDLKKAIRLILAHKQINYEGVWGPIDYDQNGDPGSSIFRIWKYDGNQVTTEKLIRYGG